MKLPADFDDDEKAFLQGRGGILPAAGAACPSPDVLRAALEQALPDEWQKQVDTHIGTCPLCRTLSESLREFEPEALTPLESRRIRARLDLPPLPVVSAEMRPAWARWWMPMGLAAAGAAAAVTLLISNPDQQPAPPPVAQTQPRDTPPPQAAAVTHRIPLTAAPLRLPLAALTMRGEEPAPEAAYLERLGVALQPYRAGRYEEAAQRLASLAAQYPRAVEPVFYEGVSLLFLDQAAQAARRLEHARTLPPGALGGEIPWYLAIAYERSERPNEASALLSALCRRDGPHRAEACKITTK